MINWKYYSRDKNNNLLWVVIDEYLQKLHDLGFIEYCARYHGAYLEKSHSIDPPDSEYSKLLIEALDKVDCFTINACEQIDTYCRTNKRLS